ncbi:LacI family DNA-binding transcriptional regulator [Lachnospiraceae bacterium JLR.KK008]
MRTTIKDVAKAAGVSPSTVSFILNNKPFPISQGTKEKVLRAVKELNYYPNQLAVSLVTRTTNMVGLILPDSSNPFFATLANHIETRLRQEGVNVIIGNTNGNPEITRQYIHIFCDRRVDGIILTQMDFEDKEQTAMCQRLLENIDIPVVYADRITRKPHHFSVEVDQKQIGYIACRHLLELGHTRIGCAAGSISLNINAARYEGYKEALAEYQIPVEESLLYCDSLSIECGTKALPCLLGQNVTAIFAFNDMVAYGIYKECRNYNLRIPQDLSVIGVDDISMSDIIQPPLTTVAQPVALIAEHAVKGMLSSIKGPQESKECVTLQPMLRVRASTAPLT